MTIDEAATEQFRNALRGRLIQPGDTDYDAARAIYNGMIDKRPRLIAYCTNVADVNAAVNFGREHALDTAIRSGGHNGPGLALIDDGLVIDLSNMKGIRVDPQATTVRVEPGCRGGDVDHATHAFGLATVSGIVATTGVPGLTLGGGHGYLSRKYGLAIDNLLAADVVLADGRLVHANDKENPDLLWALRGGGGNFGVVTSFEFGLHPVRNVIAGPLFWPIEDVETTLRWYRDWLPRQPEDVYAFYLTGAVPSGEPFPEAIRGQRVCGLMWCCTGTQQQADQVLATARQVAKPLFELVGELPYPAVQSMFDPLYPPGLRIYWKGDFVRELSDAAVAEHVRFAKVPTALTAMHLYPIDGAVSRVAPGDTAWVHRDVNWSMSIFCVDADPANDERVEQWAHDYWRALHPHSAGAAYVNFLMEEGESRVAASYGANYDRLRKIKAKYDPDNFFHVNQNIAPSA
ncbi:MAG: FAD-binding oxidoreductase [Propionivibrio sp.]